jgi:glycerol-3-phosphate acyltransferase PlsX
MMTLIVVDAMGGDNAPQAIVQGCKKAVEELDVKITLVGTEHIIKDCLGEYDNEKIGIVHSTEIISNDDDPAKAIRRKKDSSIVVAMNLLAENKAAAFVSAGSTGAVVSVATLIVK